jgi:hypothetical protein
VPHGVGIEKCELSDDLGSLTLYERCGVLIEMWTAPVKRARPRFPDHRPDAKRSDVMDTRPVRDEVDIRWHAGGNRSPRRGKRAQEDKEVAAEEAVRTGAEM